MEKLIGRKEDIENGAKIRAKLIEELLTTEPDDRDHLRMIVDTVNRLHKCRNAETFIQNRWGTADPHGLVSIQYKISLFESPAYLGEHVPASSSPILAGEIGPEERTRA